jgi:CubicO group peptidase (beta-lactamase class C family)
MLIEKHAGLAFPAFVRERIFAPLGMATATFGDSRPILPGRTTEYTRLGVTEPRRVADLRTFSYEYPTWLLTAAGIFFSADDAARWLLAIDGDQLLPRAAFREMTTTVSLNGQPFHFPGDPMGYGIGWITIDTPTHRAVGGSGGGRATILYYPDDRLGVAVLTNLQGAGPEDLADRVARLYLRDR